MLALPTFNVIRLICITTGLFAAFIAITLLIYGLSDSRACPAEWKRDTYGNCSIGVGLKITAAPAAHVLKATDIEDPEFDREAIASAAINGDPIAQLNLGILLLEGIGGSKEIPTSLL